MGELSVLAIVSHMPTQQIFFESVDASADPKTKVGGCIHRTKTDSWWIHPPTQNLESVDASTDPKPRVVGCIHQPKLKRKWVHPQPRNGFILPTVHSLLKLIMKIGQFPPKTKILQNIPLSNFACKKCTFWQSCLTPSIPLIFLKFNNPPVYSKTTPPPLIFPKINLKF